MKRDPGRPYRDLAKNKTTQVSVRLGADTTERLDHIDKYAGSIGRAELIRRAIDEFIHHVEKAGKVTTCAEIPPFKKRG